MNFTLLVPKTEDPDEQAIFMCSEDHHPIHGRDMAKHIEQEHPSFNGPVRVTSRPYANWDDVIDPLEELFTRS